MQSRLPLCHLKDLMAPQGHESPGKLVHTAEALASTYPFDTPQIQVVSQSKGDISTPVDDVIGLLRCASSHHCLGDASNQSPVSQHPAGMLSAGKLQEAGIQLA